MALFRAYPAYGHNLTVHYARNIPVRNFGNGDNFVLIGSFRANPWTALFENESTFCLSPEFGKGCFEDTSPPAGAPRLFCSPDKPRQFGDDYAHIIVRHNTEGDGRVRVISGLHMESTEAAARFFLDPRSVPEVLCALHSRSIRDLPDYELLIRNLNLAGARRSAQILPAKPLRTSR